MKNSLKYILIGVASLIAIGAAFMLRKKSPAKTGDEVIDDLNKGTQDKPASQNQNSNVENDLGISTGGTTSVPTGTGSPSITVLPSGTGNTNSTTGSTSSVTKTLTEDQKDKFIKQMKCMIDLQVYENDPVVKESQDIRLTKASEKIDKAKLKSWGITDVSVANVLRLGKLYKNSIFAGVSQTTTQRDNFINDLNLYLKNQTFAQKRVDVIKANLNIVSSAAFLIDKSKYAEIKKERIRLAVQSMLKSGNTSNIDYDLLNKRYGLGKLIAWYQIYLIAYNFQSKLNFIA